MILSPLPNNKFDINNHGPISTDYINHAWEYPEATWKRKLEIYDEHVKYTQGFFYYLANSPNSPENVRESMKGLGLAKDEFVDTNNWPFQLYVRESRRMIGPYIMTQQDRSENIHKDDSIGVGSYNIDTHNCQRFPQGDGVKNEGDIEVGFSNTFEIPYSCITPRDSEATNLLVPVCVSASHIGYGPIRLEPQYMILGQSAGVAAAMAVKSGTSVQKVDIKALQTRLLALGQVLVAEK